METEEKQPQEAVIPEKGDEAPKEDVTALKAELSKFKAMTTRYSKKLEELKSSLEERKEEPKEDTKKVIEPTGLTREEIKFYAKGFEDEDLEVAKKIALVKGVSLVEATSDDYFQNRIKAKEQAAADKKAALPASKGGSAAPQKSSAEMTKDEHRAYYLEQIEKAGVDQLR